MKPEIILRDPRPGDLGWVVMQHGEIYSREYGFTADFEAMVAEIAGKYVKNLRPAAEKCWMAEIDGERVGAVFVVRRTAATAQMRLLIVTPQARGHGVGARLTDECISFARSKGYGKLMLWTQSHLDAAHAIYQARGFKCVKRESFRAFGQDNLVGEKWELKL
jgi:GNAT superfamily N-acetyltransferase